MKKMTISGTRRFELASAVATLLFACAAFLLAGACSSDDDNPQGQGVQGGYGGQTSPEGATDDVIVTLLRVQNPEGTSGYLNAYRALPADGKIDRSDGVELSGRSQGVVYNGAIYVFDLDNTSVTRWTVGDELELERQDELSFATTGLTVACQICNAFVSPRRAFLQNSWAGTLVAWDPTTMELRDVTTIPEDALTRDGLEGEFTWPLVVRDQVYFGAGWADFDGLAFSHAAAVATFDGSVDDPNLRIVEDDRCGVNSGMQPFADDQGNVYAGGNWYSGWHQAGTPELAPNPACLLRIRPGQDAFDPDYYVDLLGATDSRAVRFARGMSGGRMLLNVWRNSEPDLSKEERQEAPEAYWSTLVWSYVILDLETLEMTPVDIPTAGAGNQTPLELDGDTLVQVYESGPVDNSEGATLYRIEDDGNVRRILSAGPGGDFSMVGRLR